MGVRYELATPLRLLKKLDIGLSGRALIIDRTSRRAIPSGHWLPADRSDAKAPMLTISAIQSWLELQAGCGVEGYAARCSISATGASSCRPSR